MSEGIIQVPPDSTGKKLRAIYKDVGGTSTHMEVLILADQSGTLIGVGNPLPIITGSGDYVNITGSLTATANVSGQWLETHILSGTFTVDISGQGVFLPDTQVVKISGDTVVIASGAIIARKLLSGLQVITQGDIVVKTSGEWLEAHLLSGEATVQSGLVVYRELLSGLQVVVQVPLVVKVSGETVDVEVPTTVKTGGLLVLSNLSGGVVLHSGAVKSVTVKAMGYNSADVFLGGSGAERPYSGYGFCLEPGEGKNYDVSNFDAIYAMATISGYGTVTFDGVN